MANKNLDNKELEELYFTTPEEWRSWLTENHHRSKGVFLIFYTIAHSNPSMRWEEAVKVALCFGWIDSTVKSLGDGKRNQYFTPRKPKSVWSALNKSYIEVLTAEGLMHPSGLKSIELAKQNGSWSSLDSVENGEIPKDLQLAFDANPNAYSNYNNFSPSARKSYLYWLSQAKRSETREKRISEIVSLCDKNIKSRQ